MFSCVWRGNSWEKAERVDVETAEGKRSNQRVQAGQLLMAQEAMGSFPWTCGKEEGSLAQEHEQPWNLLLSASHLFHPARECDGAALPVVP